MPIVDVETDAAPPRARLSWFTLYGEPLLLVLACVSVALVFNVVLRPVATSKADFYTFWDSGRAYHLGRDLYFGIPLRPGAGYNLNAPGVTVLLFAPAAYLPLPLAFAAWTLASVLMFLLASRSIARSIGRPRRWVVIASLILTSQATFLALMLGQPVALLLLILTAAWRADRSDRPIAAGLLLGMVMFAKPFLGVFVPYFIWRRAWRLLAALTAGAAVIALFGLLVAGAGAQVSWLKVLGAISWEAHFANASVLGTATRLLTLKPSGINITPPLIATGFVRPIWLVFTVLALLASTRRIARGPRIDRDWALLILLALLISPLGWAYYAPLAAAPLIASYLSASRLARALAVVGYLCLCVPPTILMKPEMGPFTAMTLGSVYCWGLFALWCSLLLEQPTPIQAAAPTPRESRLQSIS